MKRGFTLVELSIVLVIIGLLIGGILVAQSMMSAAKITAQVQQISQFDAGVETFKTGYGYLPGDSPALGGNGNGVVDMDAASCCTLANNVFDCEIANFWNNMDPAEYASSTCTVAGTQAVILGPTKNVPVAKFGSANSFFIASGLSLYSGCYAIFPNPINYYAIMAASQAQALIADNKYHFKITSSANSSTKPIDLLALDKKIDDGLGNSGNVISGSIGNCGAANGITIGGINATPLSTCSNSTTGAYQIQNNSYECTPLIRIGAQAGDLQ